MHESPRSVWVSLLLYNSEVEQARVAIRAVLKQKGELNLRLIVADNNSHQDPLPQLSEFADQCEFYRHPFNLGFCGGHNWAVKRFLDSDAQYFVTLNPDLRLEDDAILTLINEMERDSAVGTAAPLLLRANTVLEVLEPKIVDAAGMEMQASLRHFDRFSGQKFENLTLTSQEVFGASGACLIMKREFIQNAILQDNKFASDIAKVYPALWETRHDRAMLFDEAFLAYREDADLAWRAQNLGWKCRFVSNAIGYHVRRVVPENRRILPAELNRLSVRNRFLLQANNLLSFPGFATIINGIFVRNFIVIIGVLIFERTSLKGLKEAWSLFRRARANARDFLMRGAKNNITKWIK